MTSISDSPNHAPRKGPNGSGGVSMGRFSKYADGDRAPLFKPEVGESRTGRLLSVHEHSGMEGPVPVLDMEDPETGAKWSYMAGPWRARERLAALDPSDGVVLKIERHPDIGQSHDVEITFADVDAEAPPF